MIQTYPKALANYMETVLAAGHAKEANYSPTEPASERNERVFNAIKRDPKTAQQIRSFCGLTTQNAHNSINTLRRDGRIESAVLAGKTYYAVTDREGV